VLAHVAGLPIEELVTLALAAATTTGASVGARNAWRAIRGARRREATARGALSERAPRG
jgi:hypothetical protein